MNRKEKLEIIIELLDYIAKLDDSFWIDKWNLKNVYMILSTIDDDKYFNIAYKTIIAEVSWIMDNVSNLDTKISKIKFKIDEQINNFEDDKDLSIIENQFNI